MVSLSIFPSAGLSCAVYSIAQNRQKPERNLNDLQIRVQAIYFSDPSYFICPSSFFSVLALKKYISKEVDLVS